MSNVSPSERPQTTTASSYTGERPHNKGATSELFSSPSSFSSGRRAVVVLLTSPRLSVDQKNGRVSTKQPLELIP